MGTKKHTKISDLDGARYISKPLFIKDPIVIDLVESNYEEEQAKINKEEENERKRIERKHRRIRYRRLRLASAAKIAKRFGRFECSDCVGLEFDSSLELFEHLRNGHKFNKQR